MTLRSNLTEVDFNILKMNQNLKNFPFFINEIITFLTLKHLDLHQLKGI